MLRDAGMRVPQQRRTIIATLVQSYDHRAAISNSRFVRADARTVAVHWKDYRSKIGNCRSLMRLVTDKFIRRFLIHVLPDSFHRIRHYGLLASATRKANVAKTRALLGAEAKTQDDVPTAEIIPLTLLEPCPGGGGPMRIVEIFRRRPETPMPRPAKEAGRMTRCTPNWSTPTPICATFRESVVICQARKSMESPPTQIANGLDIAAPQRRERHRQSILHPRKLNPITSNAALSP